MSISGAHVLVVDDSSVDRKLIEKLLRAYSCKVTTVDSVKRALEVLGLGKDNKQTSKVPMIDMIITDYWMPEMTGLELLRRVKGSATLREIPVVVVSSEAVPQRISSCLEEGAKDFLIKPLRMSDMPRLYGYVPQKDTR